jgi:beta-glucosidase/6-phospho-beta-glucosidase/beta-galactosidase
MLASSRHEEFAKEDYRRLQEFGIRTVRLGARWHLIETEEGKYDCSSLEAFLRAAADTGTETILDLLHFGWPDHVDVFSPTFPRKFAQFVQAVARYIKRSGSPCTMFAPVNEISFLAWAGGDVACMNPFQTGRAAELKRALIQAATAASDVLLNELSSVRLVSPEPVIHIAPVDRNDLTQAREAEMYRLSQFEAWDMLSGRVAPELGGRPEFLDIIGVNYYERNQWLHNCRTLTWSDPEYRPFGEILQEVWSRYHRPIFVSETGTEGDHRPEWFNYICGEVAAAERQGVPVEGICLYPILNHPGWDDDRHCHNGLFDYADDQGYRETYRPLAQAILDQQQTRTRRTNFNYDPDHQRAHLPLSSEMGIRFSTSSAPDEPLCA